MAGYVYNPAESIRQDFQQAGSAVGNIFAQVIQQQQRDYALAENAFSNIEALKKDLNIYGQKSITSKANTLLGHASSAILQNGKLDYSKMGEIRQAVSDIKDLKTGYDLGSKEYERMLQMGLANKENLTSFEGFYKDLSAKMSDENLIKNPRDLQAALADTYTKSLDATKMFGKAYLAANPYQKVAYDVKDPKTGAMMRVEGELPVGWTVDPSTGKAMPPEAKVITNPDGSQTTVDYADQTLAQLKATNPETLAAMRRQAGAAGENYTDKQLVEYYTTKVPMLARTQQLKSADELKAQELQVDILETKAKYAERGEKADLNAKAASAAASWASANYTNKKAANEEVEMSYDPFADFTKVSFKGVATKNPINLTKFPIGKDVSLNVNGQQGIVKSVARDENGGVWVEAWQNGRDQITANMDKNDRRAGFKWRKISNFDEFNTELAQEINIGAGIPTKQKAKIRKAIGTLYNLPTRTPNIVSAAPTQKLGMYKGYNLDVLASSPDNKGATVEELKAAIDGAR
jgi:hypothetical protein